MGSKLVKLTYRSLDCGKILVENVLLLSEDEPIFKKTGESVTLGGVEMTVKDLDNYEEYVWFEDAEGVMGIDAERIISIHHIS